MGGPVVRATVYLQVAPEYKRWMADHSNPASIDGARVVGSTQRKAAKPRPGVVEVKLTIELPAAAFVPLAPEAVVTVPEDMTAAHPVVVEAQDANEE